MVKDKKPETGRVLLPSDVRPRKYRLALAPDLSRFTFDGSVEVDIDIVNPTRCVVLHAAELDFTQVELVQDGVILRPVATRVDEHGETASLEFDRPLAVGKGVLRIVFTGRLNDQMRGFYRSEYTLGGQKRIMAVTQFEATDARRAFPCWDEPAVKATFEVTLAVPADRTA